MDSKYHVRLLAMARLGLLPIEIEEGRWRGVRREERLCALGCGVVGDMHHFLNRCAALATDGVGALDRHNTELENTKSPLFFWRAKTASSSAGGGSARVSSEGSEQYQKIRQTRRMTQCKPTWMPN